MKRDDVAGHGTITWTSKCGSASAGGFDITTIEGFDEKVFTANVLYLPDSDYGRASPNYPCKPLSLAVWGQYVLDNFTTVADAAEALRTDPFYNVPVKTPDGQAGTAHLATTALIGDSAIFEYVGGKLVIHHDREYMLMPNLPTFDAQLALATCWMNIGGTTKLRGTNREADRFVRVSFYADAIDTTDSTIERLPSALSVVRNVSGPIGVPTTPGLPNVAATRWRTLFDHKNKDH